MGIFEQNSRNSRTRVGQNLMQAIILNAGRGKRLKPLTDNTHKSLLTINNKSILEHQIDTLKQIGVRRVIMVTGYRAKQLEAAARQMQGIEWKFVNNPEFETTENIVSFYLAVPYLKEETYVMMGDIMFEVSILQSLQKTNHPVAIATRSRSIYSSDDMKVIWRDHEMHLKKISKNLVNPNAEYLQISYFGRNGADLAQIFAQQMMANRVHHSWYPELLQRMADNGHSIECQLVAGNWQEIDTLEDLHNAQRTII